MTSVEAVEIALVECDRFRMRAERALERLQVGEDNNSHTAAMKRASLDLADVLVDVRGTRVRCTRKEETNTRPPIRRPESTTCDDAVVQGGTHPDPGQFLCQQCGTLNNVAVQYTSDDGLRICASCEDQKSRKWTDAPIEQEPPEPEYFKVPGTAHLEAMLHGDSVSLKYRGHSCDTWTNDIFYPLVEQDATTRSNELDSLVDGLKNKIEKKTALNQFTLALERGDVSIDSGDE